MLFGCEFLYLLNATKKVQNAWHLERVPYLETALLILDYPSRFQNGQVSGNCGSIRTDHFGQLTDALLFP